MVGAQARHLPDPLIHGTSLCCASSSAGREPSMSFVFLASQYGRRLPSDPASRRCLCLGLVVILRYLATHEGEPPTGGLHPHTHAHAGRTQRVRPDRWLACARRGRSMRSFGSSVIAATEHLLYADSEVWGDTLFSQAKSQCSEPTMRNECASSCYQLPPVAATITPPLRPGGAVKPLDAAHPNQLSPEKLER